MNNFNHTQKGVSEAPFDTSFGSQPSNSSGASQFPVTLNTGGNDLEKNLDEKLMNAFPGLESHVFQHSQPPPHTFEMPASFEDQYPSNYFPLEAPYPNQPHFPSLASPPTNALPFPTQFPYSDTDNSWQIPQLPPITSNISTGQLDPSPLSSFQPDITFHPSASSSFQNPVLRQPSGPVDFKDTSMNSTSAPTSFYGGIDTSSGNISPSPLVRSSSPEKLVIEKLKSKANQKPTETSLGSLRQTLNECLDPLNTSQAPKECVAILVNMMSTVTQDDQKLLFLEILKNNSEATIFSELVDGGRKLFLPKLRNWFVSAIRSKSDKVIHSILLLLCKLPISAERLADVKFGKPILIVKKKSANSVIRQHAERLSDLAEKSIAVELGKDQTKDAEKEPTKPETTTKATNVASTNIKNPSTKKVTSVPGTSFFKNLSNPSKTGPSITTAAKPSIVGAKQTSTSTPLSSIVAGLKGKDADLQKSQSSTQSNTRDELPSFRKRSAKSEEGSEKSEPSSEENSLKTKRRKKSVAWKSDDELVQVKIIEHANEEESAVKTPHIYGSARDLDRQEARVAFGNQVEDDVEDEIIWYKPKPIQFAISKEELHPRGYKRGGDPNAKSTLESKDEEEREGQLNANSSSITSVLSNVTEPIKVFDATAPPVSIPLPKEVEHSLHEKNSDRTSAGADEQVSENNSNTHLSSILSNLSSSASSQHLQNPSLMIPNNASASSNV